MDGVVYTPLKRIETSGGEVMKALRSDEPGFKGVEEAYFSSLGPNSVRAWKRHREMTVTVVVPVGQVRFVIADESQAELTFEEYVLGPDADYGRLAISPGLWYGFQSGPTGGIVLNLANVLHHDDESEASPPEALPFPW